MATANYERFRATADRMIRKYGAKAILRRASGDRECWAVESQQSAAEKQALKNFNSRMFLISPVDLAVPPSKEDSLVVFDANGAERAPFRQTAPVQPLAPNGFVLYYQLQVE